MVGKDFFLIKHRPDGGMACFGKMVQIMVFFTVGICRQEKFDNGW